MKKKTLQNTAAVCLLLAGICACLLTGCSMEKQELTGDTVVAAYRDTQIKWEVVESEKEYLSAVNGKDVSNQEALQQVLIFNAMLDEAEKLGLSVSQEEVDAMMEYERQSYADVEEFREMIDEYCDKAGVTLEEYYKALEDQLPHYMLRQKLRDKLGKDYCEEHGLQFTKVNPPEKMIKYVDDYLDSLLEKYSRHIHYYIDLDG